MGMSFRRESLEFLEFACIVTFSFHSRRGGERKTKLSSTFVRIFQDFSKKRENEYIRQKISKFQFIKEFFKMSGRRRCNIFVRAMVGDIFDIVIDISDFNYVLCIAVILKRKLEMHRLQQFKNVSYLCDPIFTMGSNE